MGLQIATILVVLYGHTERRTSRLTLIDFELRSIVPSLRIIVCSDRLFANEPGMRWSHGTVDPRGRDVLQDLFDALVDVRLQRGHQGLKLSIIRHTTSVA